MSGYLLMQCGACGKLFAVASTADLKDRGLLQEGGLITGDTLCSECGYNLKSLKVGAKCPECGTQISIDVNTLYRRAPRARWSLESWLGTGYLALVLAVAAAHPRLSEPHWAASFAGVLALGGIAYGITGLVTGRVRFLLDKWARPMLSGWSAVACSLLYVVLGLAFAAVAILMLWK